jgi:hypothetical protein
MKEADDTRAVLNWMAEHPWPFERRGMIAQTICDALALVAWAFWGAVTIMVIGSPFMFLWFLVFFR